MVIQFLQHFFLLVFAVFNLTGKLLLYRCQIVYLFRQGASGRLAFLQLLDDMIIHAREIFDFFGQMVTCLLMIIQKRVISCVRASSMAKPFSVSTPLFSFASVISSSISSRSFTFIVSPLWRAFSFRCSFVRYV